VSQTFGNEEESAQEDPAGQRVHAEEPLMEYLPGKHDVHDTHGEFTVQVPDEVPAGQIEQLVELAPE